MGLCTSRGKASTSGLSLGLMSLTPVCPVLLLARVSHLVRYFRGIFSSSGDAE